MSKNKIPARLRDEFYGHMQAHDNDDLPDGAWFAVLESAGHEFAIRHKLRYLDGNEAAHQYLRMSQKREEKA